MEENKDLGIKSSFIVRQSGRAHLADAASFVVVSLILDFGLIFYNRPDRLVLWLVLINLGLFIIIFLIISESKKSCFIIDEKGQLLLRESFKLRKIQLTDIKKVELGEYRGNEIIIRTVNKEVMWLNVRYFSHIGIQKILKKLKELKPDIEFDEESRKILDGEIK